MPEDHLHHDDGDDHHCEEPVDRHLVVDHQVGQGRHQDDRHQDHQARHREHQVHRQDHQDAGHQMRQQDAGQHQDAGHRKHQQDGEPQYADHHTQFHLDERSEQVPREDHQAAGAQGDPWRSSGDQAADQPDGQERLHRVRHRQPEDAAYLNVACRVVEQRDEESRESRHVPVRAEQFDWKRPNPMVPTVLREQLAPQEPQRLQLVLQEQLVRQGPQRQQLVLQPLM